MLVRLGASPEDTFPPGFKPSMRLYYSDILATLFLKPGACVGVPLAPVVVEDIFAVIRELKASDGLIIVAIEWNLAQQCARTPRQPAREQPRRDEFWW